MCNFFMNISLGVTSTSWSITMLLLSSYYMLFLRCLAGLDTTDYLMYSSGRLPLSYLCVYFSNVYLSYLLCEDVLLLLRLERF